MTTLSVRVSQDVAQKLATWARREHTDQSTAARQLLECGWTFLLLERYRQGRLSLGKLARELGQSISDTMDVVAQHGLPGIRTRYRGGRLLV